MVELHLPPALVDLRRQADAAQQLPEARIGAEAVECRVHFEKSWEARSLGPGSRVVASNLTSDPQYGTANWNDSDFVRALRQGVGRDGRTLFPMMPYRYFRSLSDEDLASVIVYERSLASVHIERPKTVLPESVTRVLQPLPPVGHIPEFDRSDPVSYGEYLVTGAHCGACHTRTMTSTTRFQDWSSQADKC